MKLFGSIGLSDHDEPGMTKVSRELIRWIQLNCGAEIVSGNTWINVTSESTFARELVVRLRLELDTLPASFWHIEYSEADINNAQLLLLWSVSYIAEIARPPSSNALDLAATKALRNPKSLGGIRPFPSVIACNQEFKDELDKSKLAGLRWIELSAREGRSEHKTIWRMLSSVVLPESPIPLQQSYGTPFDGDYTKGCLYRNPYREIELAYPKESIAAMECFDIALSREHIGNYVGACFQEIAITQAFRKVLETKKNLRGLKYTPVRLLHPGEPAIRDPFEALIHGAH